MAAPTRDNFRNLPVPIEGVARDKWFDHSTTSRCSTCKKAFGALTWKHNCRACGSIVCNECLIVYLVKVEGSISAANDKVCKDCVVKKRTVECGACSGSLLAREIDVHLSESCPHRMASCTLGCGAAKMKFKDMVSHQATNCVRRPVQCPEGCGSCVPHQDVKNHLVDICAKRSNCAWGCDKKIAQSLMIEHKATCVCRPTPCPKCMESVPFRDITSHQQSQCQSRLVQCSLGCGMKVAAKDLDHHSNNLCTHRITTCFECGNKYPLCSQEDHLDNACESRKQCELGCGTHVLPSRAQNPQSLKCRCRIINCDDCRISIQFRELNSHKASACSHRVTRCDLGCGTTGIKAKDLETHQKNACQNRMVSCPDECGAKMRLADRKEHLLNTCSNRTQCSAGCGVLVALSLLSDHRSNSCAHRQVQCPDCGTGRIMFKSLDDHKAGQCSQRTIKCSKGCGKLLKAANETDHFKTECTFRLVPCTLRCGEMVPFKEMTSHQDKSCSATVTCAVCSLSLTRSKLQQHNAAVCCRYCPNNHVLRLTERGGYKCDVCKKGLSPPSGCTSVFSMCCVGCDYDVCSTCSPSASISCTFCNTTITTKTMNTHIVSCSRYPVECSYCDHKATRSDIGAHERSCPVRYRAQQVAQQRSDPTVLIRGPETISVQDVTMGTVDTPTDHHKLAFVCHCLRRTGHAVDVVYRSDSSYTIKPIREYVRIIEEHGIGQNPKMIEVEAHVLGPTTNKFVEITSTQQMAALRGNVGLVRSVQAGTVVMLYSRSFYIDTVVKPMARQGSFPFVLIAQSAGIRY
jgi:hypothetical protein